MKKLLTAMVLFLIVVMAGVAVAETKISGDARIRPRFDTRDAGEYGNSQDDFYYYYRARININSTLGDGWFGNVRLGTNGFAYWTGKFGDPSASDNSKPSGSSVDGASRGPVDFMYIYFGRKTDQFGYWGGLLPLNSLNNPQYDVHYYPTRVVDVPFFLYSNMGAHGFGGYVKFDQVTVNAHVLVDNNEGAKSEDPDGNVIQETTDQYTVSLDAPIKLEDFTVQPVFMATIADDSMSAPITFGGNVIFPKVGNFTFSGSGFLSTNSAEGSMEYDLWYIRAKVVGKAGPGTITLWGDLAKRTDKMAGGDVEEDFQYIWASYTIPVYSSDQGSVSVKPTARLISQEIEGSKDFSRNKLELTIDFKFK